MTDIHLNFLRPAGLRTFYDAVKAERPDVLFITGDIAESDTVVRFLDELSDESGAPSYFVLGNHDYYRSGIRMVRELVQRAPKRATWLPAKEPIQLTERIVLLGVDGWGDARCGDLESKVNLSDWQLIEDFRKCRNDRAARIETLVRLGGNEARALRDLLSRAPASEELIVLTHVPPYPEACVYDGKQSEPAWLPWFTCVSTGEVLADHARQHPEQKITVLCGHTHGVGVYSPLPNLEVRTGGWTGGVEGYGNPVVQATLEL
jgi:Icc protein